jgi:hypothetical protein
MILCATATIITVVAIVVQGRVTRLSANITWNILTSGAGSWRGSCSKCLGQLALAIANEPGESDNGSRLFAYWPNAEIDTTAGSGGEWSASNTLGCQNYPAWPPSFPACGLSPTPNPHASRRLHVGLLLLALPIFLVSCERQGSSSHRFNQALAEATRSSSPTPGQCWILSKMQPVTQQALGVKDLQPRNSKRF